MTPATSIVSRWLLILAPALMLCQPTPGSENKGQYLGAMDSEPPAWFKESFLDFEEDIREAAALDKRMMIYFHQDGCPYCSRLVTENFEDPEIAALMQRQLDSIAVNMWGDREIVTIEGDAYTEKSLAAALRVNYTPTLIFFDEQGKVALRLNGYYPPGQFRLALDYVAQRQEKALGFNDYIASRHAGITGGELNAEPFFMTPPYALARNVVHAERPLAVFFEQPQCESCDLLHARVLADPNTRKLVEQFDSAQLNMWSDTPVLTPDGRRTTARDWSRELDLVYAPSIVFFDKQGREVMRIDAFLKTFHVQSVFDYVLQEAYLEEPSFQRFISARAERLREAGIDVDIYGY